jgi:hypothetical protein
MKKIIFIAFVLASVLVSALADIWPNRFVTNSDGTLINGSTLTNVAAASLVPLASVTNLNSYGTATNAQGAGQKFIGPTYGVGDGGTIFGLPSGAIDFYAFGSPVANNYQEVFRTGPYYTNGVWAYAYNGGKATFSSLVMTNPAGAANRRLWSWDYDANGCLELAARNDAGVDSQIMEFCAATQGTTVIVTNFTLSVANQPFFNAVSNGVPDGYGTASSCDILINDISTKSPFIFDHNWNLYANGSNTNLGINNYNEMDLFYPLQNSVIFNVFGMNDTNNNPSYAVEAVISPIYGQYCLSIEDDSFAPGIVELRADDGENYPCIHLHDQFTQMNNTANGNPIYQGTATNETWSSSILGNRVAYASQDNGGTYSLTDPVAGADYYQTVGANTLILNAQNSDTSTNFFIVENSTSTAITNVTSVSANKFYTQGHAGITTNLTATILASHSLVISNGIVVGIQ